MYLKSIEVQGFKDVYKRQHLRFNERYYDNIFSGYEGIYIYGYTLFEISLI